MRHQMSVAAVRTTHVPSCHFYPQKSSLNVTGRTMKSSSTGLQNWPDLNPIEKFVGYCQEEAEQTETPKCRRSAGRRQRNLGHNNARPGPNADPIHAPPPSCCHECQRKAQQRSHYFDTLFQKAK